MPFVPAGPVACWPDCCDTALVEEQTKGCLAQLPHRVVLGGQLCSTLCQGPDSFDLVVQLSADLALQHIIQ